jgi:hypothetical protein
MKETRYKPKDSRDCDETELRMTWFEIKYIHSICLEPIYWFLSLKISKVSSWNKTCDLFYYYQPENNTSHSPSRLKSTEERGPYLQNNRFIASIPITTSHNHLHSQWLSGFEKDERVFRTVKKHRFIQRTTGLWSQYHLGRQHFAFCYISQWLHVRGQSICNMYSR